jgi:threonylcarbamoyladenosine tRNA methylthiotransferase MtaB
MNRNYSGAFFADLVDRLVQAIPNLAIGVDVIAGFPGEEEKAFGNTLNLIEKLPVAYLHVFPFSKRKGTRAEGFPGQVPSQVIKARCETLRELGEKKTKFFHSSFLGQKVKLLVEGKRDREGGLLKGYSRNYIPVFIRGGDELINQEVEVEMAEVRGETVLGKIL